MEREIVIKAKDIKPRDVIRFIGPILKDLTDWSGESTSNPLTIAEVIPYNHDNRPSVFIRSAYAGTYRLPADERIVLVRRSSDEGNQIRALARVAAVAGKFLGLFARYTSEDTENPEVLARIEELRDAIDRFDLGR